MLAGADADFPFPARVGQIFVVERLDVQVLGDVGHPVAQRQGEPLAVGRAQVGGNGGTQRGGVDRLCDFAVHQVQKVADIHRHQYIGRRLRAFGAHPFEQAILDEDRIDLDAGILGEGGDQRFDELGLAGGVQIDFLGQDGTGHQRQGCGQQGQASGEGRSAEADRHDGAHSNE